MARKVPKISPTLSAMKLTEEVTFPIEQMRSVRAIASELGAIMARRYKTYSDRVNRTITVTRVE